jgi:hypothetical protein
MGRAEAATPMLGKTGGRSERPPLDTAPKLSGLGSTKTQSSRWP